MSSSAVFDPTAGAVPEKDTFETVCSFANR